MSCCTCSSSAWSSSSRHRGEYIAGLSSLVQYHWLNHWCVWAWKASWPGQVPMAWGWGLCPLPLLEPVSDYDASQIHQPVVEKVVLYALIHAPAAGTQRARLWAQPNTSGVRVAPLRSLAGHGVARLWSGLCPAEPQTRWSVAGWIGVVWARTG